MNYRDKKAWLDRHGEASNRRWDNTSYYLLWKTNGGVCFFANGTTMNDLYDNLYCTVKKELYETCEEIR